MVDAQMKLMKKAALIGGSDDAWRYGFARLNGTYELYTGEICRCRKNIKAGLHWLEIAAKQGCVGAMVELGVYYWQNNPTNHDDLSIALYWEKKAWQKGELLGAVNMAIIYALRGDGGRCNAMINLIVARKGIVNVWPYAFALLTGNCQRWFGIDCRFRRNVDEGLRLLEMAACNGISEAMLELGNFYADMETVESLSKALFWMKKAWRYGELVAAQNIAIVYSKLGRLKHCHEWLKRGYEKCRWSARFSLAKTYLCGYGVRRDEAKAEQLFREVLSDSESVQGDRRLARHYLKMIEKGIFPKADRIYP